MSETSNLRSKSTASTTALSAELLEQLKEQLAEPLFATVVRELQYAQLKIQVLEERLRLHRIEKYGPGSEKLTNAQLELLEQEPGVSREEVEAESERDAIGEEAGATESNQTRRKRRKHPGRQSLPAHLPRVERVIGCTSEQCVCTGCGGERVVIGYEESEQLDVEPARYFVLVTKREKRACKCCEEHGVVTAPLVPRIIEKSLVSDQIIIDTVVDKYASHLPLYRQSVILNRDAGIELSRATLDGWVMRVGELLTPIVEVMRRELLSGSYIQADETPVDVQTNSKRGRNHHAYLWQYGSPGGSVVFDFRMGRGREGPKQFLANFEGILQTDGYAAYDQIGGEHMVHAACWAHARRAFFEAVQLNRDDVAATRIVAWIDELFAIDRKARDENMNHAARHALRRQQAPALLENLRRHIEQCQAATLPASALGKACRYTLALWTKLTCFLEHPELELSNNLAENSMRPVAIGRKNWIHVGSAQAGPKIAAILSVVESCRRMKVPVRNYLATVLPGLNNASIQRVSAFATFVFVCAWIRFGATPLERYYLPTYERTSIMSVLSRTHQSVYRVLFVASGRLPPRPAVNGEVILGRTQEADGKTIPLALSPSALQQGYTLLFRGPRRSFVDARLRDFLREAAYGKSSLLEFFRPPFIGGAVVFFVLLPFAAWKDVERQKQLRYGRRLKGPEMLTPRQFNRIVKGDGAGFKTDQMRKMLRIPARAEAQHIQIIGDTGAGKTALMFQLLRQVRSRGDSAIVYDPAREFVKRFYDPSRGDVILNPLDKRCPYWGPSDELRSRSEAKALAVSLFQPPQDKKGEFFIESPQKIFAFLMAYGPTPDELVQWMSNPEEIDRRLKGTEHAHLIDQHAHQQRAGVLGSLGLVADSLRLLPKQSEANGTWTATEWAEKRRGWLFLTSLPAEREALRPLQSLWIDWLVLRLLNEPTEAQKRVWFVIDELASLQKLPQLHTAITEARKSRNPVVLGFQGKAQLEYLYGHLAEVMLSQPATSVWLTTKEPSAGEWVSKFIGKVEVERLRETHFDGTRSGRNFALDRQVEPLVLESEISGLPDLHAYMKYQNYVTRFSFPYFDMQKIAEGFERRDLTNDKLPFDPSRKRGAARETSNAELKQAPPSATEPPVSTFTAAQQIEPEPVVGHDPDEQQNFILRG